jgi:hypothetical protein
VIHYHGTPITPRSVLYQLAGKHFCVSFAAPQDVEVCHQIGQSVMLDNGAFSFWRQGKATDWTGYYAWASRWLDCRTTWAVIPDVIDGSEKENSELVSETVRYFGRLNQLAPVWHMHESLDRLDHLASTWDRFCIGSSGAYASIDSPAWNNRMNEAFNRICRGSGRPPAWIHMLRGMSLSGSIYPFASVDSTDVARNHHRPQNDARKMADLWDAQQCPVAWKSVPIQQGLEVVTD